MWLLHIQTMRLREFQGDQKPAYAILSHTWGNDELLFHEVDEAANPTGLVSFTNAAQKKRAIKRSSAELSEALYSMYKWYQAAKLCIIPLEDMFNFENSRWLTRGWTLQELIACEKRVWLDAGWHLIPSHPFEAAHTTLLETPVINGGNSYCVAERMSWASRRTTTRPEDQA
ncbi:hypothetical protein M011DRAFT_494991 [Sporormia fimetaria CBS 119925]|uniref:Heterokaryon incompatibility domain-containing protein n=1 Tax=Sporormia fimetaria CBS 119925 TaxID=1340428 RepID=A0A6A6V8W3_9PLEO|nr:hypothetical protein M011DRAFT_494991 [Sporormia fimetaria CBS 119925]